MYTLYKDLGDEKILLAYFGVFSDEIMSMLIDLSEGYMSKIDNFKKLSRKVSYLIVESFQNLVRHGIIEKSNYSEIEYSKDFFQITISEDIIGVASANVILHKNVEGLEKKIDHLNSLNVDELRKFKREILEKREFSEKGGAGLGLIEMKRKSDLPLQKQVIRLTDEYSLLILNLEIPMNKNTVVSKTDVKTIEKLYKKLVKQKVLLLYKGGFSKSSNSNLIEMLDKNFMKNDKIISNKLKNIVAVIEVMQNVSKHGKSIDGNIEGIFSVNEINSELYIECSNFIKREDYKKLKRILKSIKSSSLEELNIQYKEKLKNSYFSDSNNAGLGLLEIARFTKNTFTYNFIETENNEIFYSINIKTT